MFSDELLRMIYADERFYRHSIKAQTEILQVIEEKIEELEMEVISNDVSEPKL